MSKAKTSNPYARKLTIQMGVCKRMSKEASYYVKEVEENSARVKKMKEDDQDPFDIKKQEEVLDESVMMVPDSRRRLGEVMQALEELLAEAPEGQAEGGDSDEKVAEARALLAAFREEEAQLEAAK
eukprot:CAMPEP_0114435880 /NCGR_PEP_ID=MMETSP0103-20121206/13105_1 /TAXON_ID=37642 ORGANISM="Paraphysomonas imperforata, Strain PA2" /NCGR_SAMPLE_ID=MMETSP0103 /ASSEMBLY_ACC=CAM_ASM_000201 /LENGTH=125 /DNA_ID=CAMNT_0001606013 /DNA_START=32 /DNA_END=412 /DNA_ORIENTATION=-